MEQTVSVKLDDEQQDLLQALLRARRDKSKSRIIREALWCYAEKILPESITNEINCRISSAVLKNQKKGKEK